ncbi:carboxymuconolactone decarboxylase family protein [Georgenia sp. Z1491]|uniref:carboxymuconolactone decarboxylase family protein n=1 Tax=Georgenia sp. Z1491 TaxID=3416707 RepID=UPI003CF3D9FE
MSPGRIVDGERGVQHGRIPWYSRAELDDEQIGVYESIVGGPRASTSAFRLTNDDGRLEGPFNAMLVAPRLGSVLQELGAAIRYRTSLSNREREVAILALAALRRSDFEWYAHERVGHAAGLTHEEIAGIADGHAVDTLSVAERLAHDVVGELARERDLSDERHAEARETLGLQRLAELVTLVGYYDTLSLSLTVWRTPLPEGELSTFQQD